MMNDDMNVNNGYTLPKMQNGIIMKHVCDSIKFCNHM